MAEKKSFWSTLPGLVTGIAAIVTGMVALVPVVLSASHSHHTGSVTAANSASPMTSPGAGGVTTTATASAAQASPDTSGSPGATPSGQASPGSSPGAGPSAGPGASPSAGPVALTSNPDHLDFGSVAVGQSSSETITLANPGPGPATLDSIDPTGSGDFTVASTTCGKGVALASQGTCQVIVRFAPPSLGPATGALSVTFHPALSGPLTVALTGSGGL